MTRTLQWTGFNPVALKIAALKALGTTFLALGTVGIVVPLLPTTVLWILAVTCFAKSAPEHAERLMTHPRFGSALRDFVRHDVLSRTTKVFSIGGMATSFAVGMFAMELSYGLAACVAVPMLVVAVYFGSRNEKVPA